MAVNTYHPLITPERRYEWRLMRDCMDGEARMKRQRELYLPRPSGFPISDNQSPMYDAYIGRAQFPELLAPSVSAMIGIIHGQEITIEIPSAMEFLLENADGDGLPLEAFHRRITRELLIIGGGSVLTDAPEASGEPYLVFHCRDKLINWDDDFYVLDECSMARNGFVWEQLEKYRVLTMDGLAYTPFIHHSAEMPNGEPIEVRGRGGSVLPRIPFAVASAVDLSPRVEAPPLIGVANSAKAIYQLSADYRHQLFMSGQETLVALNGEAPSIVGAGAVHEMHGNETQTPDLKYVSPTCSGIDAHERAMKLNREAAVMAGARLFEQTSGNAESGEAKRLRYASETATLTSVAQNSCLLLERALRNAAMIMGLPEDDINVTPPADLMDRAISPQDFAALHGVYVDGGISWETFYENGQRGGIFSPDRTSEEEQRLLDGSVADGDETV